MQGIDDLTHSPSLKLGSLMCLIRMAVFYPITANQQLPTPKAVSNLPNNTHQKTIVQTAKPLADWSEIAKKITISPMLKSIVENCVIKEQNQSKWTLMLSPSHKHLLSEQACEKIQSAVQQLTT